MDKSVDVGALIAAGRLREAQAALKAYVATGRGDAEILALLGRLAFAFKDLAEAEGWMSDALAMRPDDPALRHELGTILLAAGRAEAALACFALVLERHPTAPDTLYNQGCALRALNRHAAAADAFAAACAAAPGKGEAWFNLGNSQMACGRHALAVESYRRAMGSDTPPPGIEVNLAQALRAIGRADQAATVMRAAHHHAPSAATAAALAAALADLGEIDEAEAYFRAALRTAPPEPATVNNLFILLHRQRRGNEIADLIDATLATAPENADLHVCAGLAKAELREFAAAEAALLAAVRLQPDHGQALNNLGLVRAQLGDYVSAVQWFRRAHAAEPENATVHSNLLFALLHGNLLSPEQLLEEHLRFGEIHERRWPAIVHPPPAAGDSARQLRIGFVSADFRKHAVDYFFRPIFDGLDRDAFAIFLYCNTDRTDDVTAHYRSRGDQWRMIAGQSVEAVVERIRDDRIDILVDLSGHTAGNALPVFARKPAPVQMTMLGYPCTTGLRRIDYRVVGQAITPADVALNAERLINGSWGTFRFPDDAPDVTAPPCLRNGRPTLGSFNKPLKVTEDVLDAWCEILARVPQAVLIMHVPGSDAESVRQPWLDRFERRGVDRARVTLFPTLPLADFLAMFGRVDVALDPFPYAGGTTSLMSLWMGVPLVCVVGDGDIGDTATGILRDLGFADLIAPDVPTYVERAVALMNDPARQVELRAQLRPALKISPLVDRRRAATAFADILRQVWRHYRDQAPAPTSAAGRC